VRYIAILIAMLAVLALALIGLPTSGSTLTGPAPGTTPTSTPVSAPAAQQSEGGYGSAIQAARNAVSVASQDAQSGASANP
jgi:type IV secretory pathway TrbL component